MVMFKNYKIILLHIKIFQWLFKVLRGVPIKCSGFLRNNKYNLFFATYLYLFYKFDENFRLVVLSKIKIKFIKFLKRIGFKHKKMC